MNLSTKVGCPMCADLCGVCLALLQFSPQPFPFRDTNMQLRFKVIQSLCQVNFSWRAADKTTCALFVPEQFFQSTSSAEVVPHSFLRSLINIAYFQFGVDGNQYSARRRQVLLWMSLVIPTIDSSGVCWLFQGNNECHLLYFRTQCCGLEAEFLDHSIFCLDFIFNIPNQFLCNDLSCSLILWSHIIPFL